MKPTKKQVLSVLMILCLMFALAACGGNDSGSDGEADTPSVMDKDAYLDQVETLNTAAGEFTTTCSDFISIATSDPEDTEALADAIEKVRATKQAFLDFGEITNPPEGYEDAHGKLAESAKKFGEFIDTYCDVLADSLNGEENEAAATIQSDMTTIVNDMAAAMSKVENIG